MAARWEVQERKSIFDKVRRKNEYFYKKALERLFFAKRNPFWRRQLRTAKVNTQEGKQEAHHHAILHTVCIAKGVELHGRLEEIYEHSDKG